VRQELARTCAQVGDIYRLLGDHAKSQEHYGRMIDMADELPETLRNQPAFLQDLAAAHSGRSLSLKATDKLPEAVADARAAVALQEQANSAGGDTPEARADLARRHYYLGVVLAASPNGLEEAEKAYRQALLGQRSPKTPLQQRELARTLNNLGMLLSRTKRPAEAYLAFDEARGLQQDLVNRYKEKPVYRLELARTCNNIAVLHQSDPRKLAECEAAYDQVRALFEALVRDFPSVPDYRHLLAMCHANVAMLHRGVRKFGPAVERLDQALAIQRQLVDEFPSVADYRQRLGRTFISLGNCQRDQRRDVEAAASYREAVAIYEKLLLDAGLADYHNGLAVARFALGRLNRERPVLVPVVDTAMSLGWALGGGLDQVEQLIDLRLAVRQQEEALRLNTQNAVYRNDLNNYHLALVQALLVYGHHTEAGQSARRIAELLPDDHTAAHRGAYWLARCVAAVELDRRLSEGERDRQAEVYAADAVKLLRRAINQGYKNHAALSQAPFDVLQSYPEFRKLLEELKTKTTKEIAHGSLPVILSGR
jgi:tetratricopeptide (TPR) repeat protein